MVAKVRVVVELPFDYDVGEPDENGNNPKMSEAANFANNDVLNIAKNALAGTGTIIDDECMVEEVRLEQGVNQP